MYLLHMTRWCHLTPVDRGGRLVAPTDADRGCWMPPVSRRLGRMTDAERDSRASPIVRLAALGRSQQSADTQETLHRRNGGAPHSGQGFEVSIPTREYPQREHSSPLTAILARRLAHHAAAASAAQTDHRGMLTYARLLPPDPRTSTRGRQAGGAICRCGTKFHPTLPNPAREPSLSLMDHMTRNRESLTSRLR